MEKHILVLCLLGNPYQRAEGGFHKTIYEIIEYFKEKDIIITIITSNTTLSEDSFQQKYSNINLWELALNPEWIENQDKLYINANYITDKIQQIITKSQIEISLIHSFQWINGYLTTKINVQQKISHVHSIISSSFDRQASGFALRSQYQRQCENLTFKTADLLISITEAEKKQLIDYYNIAPSKIFIMGRTADLYYSYFYDIYHSQISKVDKQKYNSILVKGNVPKRQKVFAYVGRIINYKGILEIIKAWHILYIEYADEMPPLWLIGGSEKTIYQFRDSLINEIPFLAECEKKHKIYWWGYMESYGISTIFQKSHVLLMHSAFEPGGRVLLEAMSAGKPIIATPTGFAQTYIKNWYNGFQVEYQDIDRLAAYMKLFIINEYLSSMMGIYAKKTYYILNNEWKYYERLDKLYHSDETKFKEIPQSKLEFDISHPLLVDEFPYCDIKNDIADLSYLINSPASNIEEINKHKSYIWKLSSGNEVFFAKQVYNRINIKQLWNPFDPQKVHTIWMQYHTATLSIKYPCIILPSIISEKLFTYLLPYCEILSDSHVYKLYPVLLKQLASYEYGICKSNTSYDEQNRSFKEMNQSIQYKHKYYTINIYVYELQKVFEKTKTIFQLYEISILKHCFQEIRLYLSLRDQIEYGLNYGKPFLEYVIRQNNVDLLLPSSDIFIGELGQDEGIIFTIYYLKYHVFLETTYYPKKVVLIWSLLYCIELFISSKILHKSESVIVSNLKEICTAINSET